VELCERYLLAEYNVLQAPNRSFTSTVIAWLYSE
jgi:hypothetical protein